MISQTKVQREITSMALCVTGLSFIMIGFFILAGKCDLSIVLGAIIGSVASIMNYFLHVLTIRISAKYNSEKAVLMILMSKVFRMLFMSTIAFIILLFPVLHDVTGIVALFFPQISRAIISRIKN